MKNAQALIFFLWVVGSLTLVSGLSAQDVVTIVGDKVGIKQPNPSAQLTVKSTATNQDVVLVESSDDQLLVRFYETSGTGALFSLFDNNQGERFRISGTGTPNWFSGPIGLNCSLNNTHSLVVHAGVNAKGVDCTAGGGSYMDAGDTSFTATSSRSLKENLVPIERSPEMLTAVEKVQVYSYDFIDGPKGKVGLMAEDFFEVLGTGDGKTINGQHVDMALWLAVQELVRENRELRERVEVLEAGD